MSKFDFSIARTKHIAWKSKLRGFLDGKETLNESQALSHHECDLGKWLDSEGFIKYGNIAEMKELGKVHEELHHLVQNVVSLKKAGNETQAETELLKLGPTSRTIIDLLTVIETKVQ